MAQLPFVSRARALLAAAVAIATAPAVGETPSPPFTAEVDRERVELRAGAGDFYPVGVAERGDRLRVVERIESSGGTVWFQIEPPEGVFSFVTAEHVRRLADGNTGRVMEPDTPVEAASVEGPAFSFRQQKFLEKGSDLEIVERIGDVYKIVPPEGAYVFVRASALSPAPEKRGTDDHAAEGHADRDVIWRHELGPASGDTGEARTPVPEDGDDGEGKAEAPERDGTAAAEKPSAAAGAPTTRPSGAGTTTRPAAGLAYTSKAGGEAVPVPSDDAGEEATESADAAGADDGPEKPAKPADSATPATEPSEPAGSAEAPKRAGIPGDSDSAAPADEEPSGRAEPSESEESPSAAAARADASTATGTSAGPRTQPVSSTPSTAPGFDPLGESEAVRDAERRLHAVSDRPLAERPVDRLLARYRELQEQKSLSPLDRRIVEHRLEQLTRQRKAKAAIKEIRAAREASGVPEQPAPKAPSEQEPDYDAVGLLLASAVFDGESARRLFRVVEPESGHTIVYLEPGRTWSPAQSLGRIVGVAGSPTDAGIRQTRVLRVERIDVLRSGPYERGRPEESS